MVYDAASLAVSERLDYFFDLSFLRTLASIAVDAHSNELRPS